MSTAFMVDSILQDKEDQTHDSFSSALDTDSDQNSDHKDSVCDSPPPNYHHHHRRRLNGGVGGIIGGNDGPHELLQSYAVLRNSQAMGRSNGNLLHVDTADLASNDGSICGDSDGGGSSTGCATDTTDRGIIGSGRGSDGGDGNSDCMATELCCAKCGHFQIGNNKTIIDNEIHYEFKCYKCGCGDYLHPKETNVISAVVTAKDSMNSVNSVKPMLKFSVSAILGDRNDSGKVRHGK